jgi:hypothetical protein
LYCRDMYAVYSVSAADTRNSTTHGLSVFKFAVDVTAAQG